MKLDRNINPDGRGKYALINMRAVHDSTLNENARNNIQEALETLANYGAITYGNESAGDQFFVMKHKDKFTADGYAEELEREEKKAREIGNRLPD